jgi:hypothetical protein
MSIAKSPQEQQGWFVKAKSTCETAFRLDSTDSISLMNVSSKDIPGVHDLVLLSRPVLDADSW